MRQWLMLLCLTALIQPAHVQRVIDGDTLVLFHVGTPPEERVRLLGVDTPERGQPGANEATAFTKSWLQRGAWTLTACQRDSFGRLLGTATRDGSSLGTQLVEAGLAVERKR